MPRVARIKKKEKKKEEAKNNSSIEDIKERKTPKSRKDLYAEVKSKYKGPHTSGLHLANRLVSQSLKISPVNANDIQKVKDYGH